MSSTSTVCQGLQSCLEPILIEPRVLVHQLATSKQGPSLPWLKKQTEIPNPENPKHFPIKKNCENIKTDQEKKKSTWNLLQSLNKNSYTCRKLSDDHQEEVYIHPLVKRSTSALSSRSLQMCTESLGSETGDGIDSYNGGFSYNIIEKQSSSPINIPKTREIRKKVKHSSSFPPPLTSISGNDGVQVQTHREGGRLVIKAYSHSSSNTCFQTERENGRLRLSLPRDGYGGDDEDVEEKNVDESEKSFGENDDKEDEFHGSFWGESVKEDGGKVGCKIGGGEWSSSRCNGDSSKRIPSLPFCVAIS
ncbi:hypothetical protein BUALT_Bualt02G0220700 [Buddleja alternifolia]|uniref:FAF domain-containing protein n=1 Tax=Buddleja alternifolia TaxID=168488 RepID=A0AAV6YDC2_9LAMI|nr:hypothetical protein BUALT_Bualt02G0220700 [Buddleja alternifolia]